MGCIGPGYREIFTPRVENQMDNMENKIETRFMRFVGILVEVGRLSKLCSLL